MLDRRKRVNDFRGNHRSGAERRGSIRYDTDDAPVWVTWQLGDQRGCGQGRLRDLSVSGAALLTEEYPPLGARLQIRLETHASVPAVEGTVLRVAKKRRFLGGSGLVISLRFVIPCPYEFFTAVVYGR